MESITRKSIPQDTSDENLVRLTNGGEATAFTMLVERHHQYAIRIASRFLLSEEDTEDVVQEAFIKVWRNLALYNSRSLFTTWLYTIVVNLCLDRLKISRRKQETTLTEAMIHELSGAGDAGDQVQQLDSGTISRAIREFAGDLSLIQRQVFILRDLQDLSVDEVCRITGYDTDKVKANLYHARKYMREKLIKEGYL